MIVKLALNFGCFRCFLPNSTLLSREYSEISPINLHNQQELLCAVGKSVSIDHHRMLDAALMEKELQTAVNQLQDEKSPSIDSITAKFYKHIWYLIGVQYFTYINAVRQTELPTGKNTSVTAILFKVKGDVDDLKNY